MKIAVNNRKKIFRSIWLSHSPHAISRYFSLSLSRFWLRSVCCSSGFYLSVSNDNNNVTILSLGYSFRVIHVATRFMGCRGACTHTHSFVSGDSRWIRMESENIFAIRTIISFHCRFSSLFLGFCECSAHTILHEFFMAAVITRQTMYFKCASVNCLSLLLPLPPPSTSPRLSFPKKTSCNAFCRTKYDYHNHLYTEQFTQCRRHIDHIYTWCLHSFFFLRFPFLIVELCGHECCERRQSTTLLDACLAGGWRWRYFGCCNFFMREYCIYILYANFSRRFFPPPLLRLFIVLFSVYFIIETMWGEAAIGLFCTPSLSIAIPPT